MSKEKKSKNIGSLEKIQEELTKYEQDMTKPEAEGQHPNTEDFDYIADTRRAILDEKIPWAHAILGATVIFILVMLIWAHYAIVDEVTSGSGKVIPSSSVQVVQNLEGGILKEILVKEGDVVTKEQILLRIDDVRFASSYRESLQRYYALQASIARLNALIQGKDKIIFPVKLEKEHPSLVKKEIALFESQKRQNKTAMDTTKRSLALAKEELNITKPLVKEGVLSKIELLRIEREVSELQGKLDEMRDNVRAEEQNQLDQDKDELNMLKESLAALEDRKTRTTIRSPVNGTVKQINISTVGGVIQPGMDILEVVPLEDNLLVQAQIKPADIAFIRPGQKAKVKITAYDFAIYGALDAKVEHISADTIMDENGESYYKVNVRTQKNYLGNPQSPLPIIPGMVTSVDVLTGEKSVLDYLLKPILKTKQKALRER